MLRKFFFTLGWYILGKNSSLVFKTNQNTEDNINEESIINICDSLPKNNSTSTTDDFNDSNVCSKNDK